MYFLKRLQRVSLILLICSHYAHAELIDHDAGTLTFEGISVLKDANNPDRYYYLPPYPRLARNAQDDFEILLLKTTGSQAQDNGGIFHALIEFDIPDDVRERVAEQLATARPGAELAGPLPLLESDDANDSGSFRVTSASLGPSEDNPTGNIVTSGAAPRHGSKAAIAAKLDQGTATILMDSLTGSTADVSVSVRGYYEAKVRAYNAVVQADMDTVYSHSSLVDSFQKKYTRRQVRDVVDELEQAGAISVDVFDRSEGENVPSADLSAVLDIVTEKLVETMFDTQTGWSRTPEPEVAVAEGQIKGRLEQGWLQSIFTNADDEPYYTDDQYVLKQRSDVRSNRFYLNLSQSSTIRVPVDSTGNLGGFYNSLTQEQRARYFRVISPVLDSDMQRKEIFFQLDADAREVFADTFNNVVVNVRQRASGNDSAFTRSLRFASTDLENGNGLQSFDLFREGDSSDEWAQFEYQTVWSLRDVSEPVRTPPDANDWIESSDAAITLIPPLQRSSITIEVDTRDFESLGIAAAEVMVATTLQGKAHLVSRQTIRADATEPRLSDVFYRDEEERSAWRVVWHTSEGRASTQFAWLDSELLYITPPSADWLAERVE